MTTQRTINVLLALALAALLSTAHLLDGPDDIATAQAQALSLQDAINTQSAETRLLQFVAHICGQNAGFKLLDDGAVQCYTHRGRKTMLVPATAAQQVATR